MTDNIRTYDPSKIELRRERLFYRDEPVIGTNADGLDRRFVKQFREGLERELVAEDTLPSGAVIRQYRSGAFSISTPFHKDQWA